MICPIGQLSGPLLRLNLLRFFDDLPYPLAGVTGHLSKVDLTHPVIERGDECLPWLA